MRRFEGMSAVVTGAGRGIGQAVADAFREEGAAVCYLDRDAAAAAEAAARPIDGGGPALALACDITREAEVADAIGEIALHQGGIQVLVNNAGVCTLNLATDLSEAEWDLVMDVNVKGMWLCAKHALPHLRRDGGAIVNVASQAARRAQKFTAHYSASKMAVIGFTRALAVEEAPLVRVNAVSPGTIDTPMIEQEIRWRVARGHDDDPDTVRDDWLRRIPMGRFQEPAQIAAAILFLASREASATTGECLNVSGGAVME